MSAQGGCWPWLLAPSWRRGGMLQVENLQALGLHQIAAGRLRLLRVDALQRLAEYHALPLHSRPLI